MRERENKKRKKEEEEEEGEVEEEEEKKEDQQKSGVGEERGEIPNINMGHLDLVASPMPALFIHKQDSTSSLGRVRGSGFVSCNAKRVWTYSSLASPISTALTSLTPAFKSQQSPSFFCQNPGSHLPHPPL